MDNSLQTQELPVFSFELGHGQNLNAWETDRFQDLKVIVIGNQASSIGCDGAIYKLVIVGVLSDKLKLEEDVRLFDVWADNKKVGKVFGYLHISFTG